MKAKVEISTFVQADRTSNREAWVYVNDDCIGQITAIRSNVGSLLNPRYQITSYDVEVEVDGLDIQKEFATRGAATAFVRSLFA